MLTLYRAVQPDELADIQRTGQFVNRGSAEGKYFSLTGEGTSAYAKQAVQAFDDPAYTLVTTQIPEDMITPAMRELSIGECQQSLCLTTYYHLSYQK